MKKILLSLLLAAGVQNSFAMGSCGGGRAAQGGGQAAESSSRLEGQVPVLFSDGSVANLDLKRLKALNSGLLERVLFTADGLSGLGKSSEDNLIVMQEFTNLADFEKFEKILKGQLSGEIADMVDFFKKADFLGINTDDHLKGLLARDKAQFLELCRALLAENQRFVLNMQRVYPEILHEAIRTKDRDFAKNLIKAGADVKIIDRFGSTALMKAAENGQTEMAQLLIASGADVNASSLSGWTALMLAARVGHTEIARLLSAHGADVNARNGVGHHSVLELAAMYGHTETVKLLIDGGADVNARDNRGRTALMIAATNGHVGVIQELIAHGADFNAQNAQGMTALMIAAQSGRAAVVSELLMHHADIKVQASHGTTAFMFAAKGGHVEVVRELLTQRSDEIGEMKVTECGTKFVVKPQPGHLAETIKAAINIKDNKGGTALIYAAQSGNAEIVRMLLSFWPDLDARMDGETALMVAARNGHAEISQLLCDSGALE
jgi:ankyrin repeat protein